MELGGFGGSREAGGGALRSQAVGEVWDGPDSDDARQVPGWLGCEL